MTKVKICGLTNLADARAATQAGADFLGFVFHPPSPRYIEPAAAGEIVQALRAEALDFQAVGVFVDQDLAAVEMTMTTANLDLAQLHGAEPPAMLDHLAGRAFKAINPRTLDEAETLADRYPGQLLLLDAYHPQLRGGTGHTADWKIAAGIAARRDVLLAGGLNPRNVGAAIKQVKPWGVDVSSGVEASKGKKDHALLRAFVAVARSQARPRRVRRNA